MLRKFMPNYHDKLNGWLTNNVPIKQPLLSIVKQKRIGIRCLFILYYFLLIYLLCLDADVST